MGDSRKGEHARKMPKEYLGDGVYADFDWAALVLTTEDGVEVKNRIVLEPEVWMALQHYVTRLREHNKQRYGTEVIEAACE